MGLSPFEANERRERTIGWIGCAFAVGCAIWAGSMGNPTWNPFLALIFAFGGLIAGGVAWALIVRHVVGAMIPKHYHQSADALEELSRNEAIALVRRTRNWTYLSNSHYKHTSPDLTIDVEEYPGGFWESEEKAGHYSGGYRITVTSGNEKIGRFSESYGSKRIDLARCFQHVERIGKPAEQRQKEKAEEERRRSDREAREREEGRKLHEALRRRKAALDRVRRKIGWF